MHCYLSPYKNDEFQALSGVSRTELCYLPLCEPIRRKQVSPLIDTSNLPESESADRSRDGRPTHSYARLISEAILSSPAQKLTLSDIYAQIAAKYAYFGSASPGWKNSVRHNLSLSKIFKKVPRVKGQGKGCYWEVDKEVLKRECLGAKRRKSPRFAERKEIPVPETYIPYQYSCYQGVPYPPNELPFSPPQELAPFLPNPRNQLCDSFRTFYRSMLDAHRVEEVPAAKRQKFETAPDTSLSALKQKMDSLARGSDSLSDIDVSSFEQLVQSLNPADKQSGQLYSGLRESFSHFLREVTTCGTKNFQMELPPLPEQFSSNESSSQEFDWNAIL